MNEDWNYIDICLFSYYRSYEYRQFRINILTIIHKDNGRSLLSYDNDNGCICINFLFLRWTNEK